MTETMTGAEYRAELNKLPKVSKSEQIARTFALHCRARKLPEPRCRFHPEGEVRFMLGETITRQSKRLKNRQASPLWRFDFAWPEQRIAVEIEGVCVRKDSAGATQMGGRHANIQGFKDDCEKYAWAAVMGWRVLRFEQSQVGKGFAIDMLVRLWASLEAVELRQHEIPTHDQRLHVSPLLAAALELWKPYRVGDYWQCATPTGPYNFSAADEAAAQRICDRERASVEPGLPVIERLHELGRGMTDELNFGGKLDRDPF